MASRMPPSRLNLVKNNLVELQPALSERALDGMFARSVEIVETFRWHDTAKGFDESAFPKLEAAIRPGR